MNLDGGGSETPNVPTSATETNTNTNMPADPNNESNNTPLEFPPPQGVELMFDLAPGSIPNDSVEAAFVNPTASSAATGLPTAVSRSY